MSAVPDASSKITVNPTISTGVPGLDDVLAGGLTKDRVYLVEGTPGTGKTTLSLRRRG
jgi:circadian clock protein KaiC